MPASNSETRKRHEAQADAIEEAVDDLHRAAEIIESLAIRLPWDAVTVDAPLFTVHIREIWDR